MFIFKVVHDAAGCRGVSKTVKEKWKLNRKKRRSFREPWPLECSCLVNNTQDSITVHKVTEMEMECRNGMSHVDTQNAWALSLQNVNVRSQRVKAIMFFAASKTGHRRLPRTGRGKMPEVWPKSRGLSSLARWALSLSLPLPHCHHCGPLVSIPFLLALTSMNPLLTGQCMCFVLSRAFFFPFLFA